VGSNAITRAKAYDENHFNVGAKLVTAKEKILELDKKYKISDKAIEGKDYLVSSIQNLWKSTPSKQTQ